MATLGDLREILAQQIAALMYPNGIEQPPIVTVPGTVKIVPSWPKAVDLSLQKLAPPPDGAGNLIIAVQDTANRDVTRYEPLSYLVQKGVPTLAWAASADGRTITLSGTVTTPQNLAIIIGDVDFTYSVQAGDSIASIIAALAALINPTIPVDPDANSLYFPNSGNAIEVVARVGSFSKYVTLTGQYKATMCVAIWCGHDAARQQVVRTIKPMLDLMRRVTLPDGTIGTFGTGREVTITDMEGMGVESTRLLYTVDYSSAESFLAPQAIVIRSRFVDAEGNLILQKEA
jgi:hypothetical protein